MRKIDDIFPSLKLVPAIIIATIFAIVLELSGSWVTMLIAGILGSLFTRTSKRAFLVGFVGVAIAWTLLFAYLSFSASALEIADFFIGLLGLSGMGMLVIVISVLLGALLGGFGGLLGRNAVQLIDEALHEPAKESAPQQQTT
ncbi:MAG: hypothetical protein C4K49_05535 [Candidatus Thorarchaeota archaeon]|nr:MAG: hypothetical protein C4K49_05535 [Candidatus Thorarchaeota archaeon]